ASPAPRAARSSARPRARRASSTAPARTRRSSVSVRAAGATCARLRRSESSRSEKSRRRSELAAFTIARCRRTTRRTRRARSRPSSTPTSSPAARTTSAGSVLQGSPSSSTSMRSRGRARGALTLGGNLFDGSLGLLLARRTVGVGRDGKQPRGGDASLSELGLDSLHDLVGDVRVLAQEGGRVLPALAQSLLVEAEVRAG